MDVFMPYKAALMDECSITLFTRMWTLTPLCITGVFPFSTGYMELFTGSALVKTQRLYIRTYCDRKSNYLYSNVYSK
jgi:hypothetical protein